MPTIIKTGAFENTIVEDADRIKILWQHNPDWPIGKPTLLRENSEGLEFVAELSDTQQANEALELIRDGVINEVAFDRVREGADDFRYYTTLKKLIAEKKGTPAARKAQKLVDEILASMTLGRSSMFTDLDADATNRRCGEYRARIIEAILTLSAPRP